MHRSGPTGTRWGMTRPSRAAAVPVAQTAPPVLAVHEPSLENLEGDTTDTLVVVRGRLPNFLFPDALQPRRRRRAGRGQRRTRCAGVVARAAKRGGGGGSTPPPAPRETSPSPPWLPPPKPLLQRPNSQKRGITPPAR